MEVLLFALRILCVKAFAVATCAFFAIVFRLVVSDVRELPSVSEVEILSWNFFRSFIFGFSSLEGLKSGLKAYLRGERSDPLLLTFSAHFQSFAIFLRDTHRLQAHCSKNETSYFDSLNF